ncbi:hypothetical protein RclHR1_07040006 [Rhizophagus clarus]|uniref:Tropomyosin beta chain n=1 Tax=Rhizophagus clarus TaxID=94130 RepID=A0A2Z6S176_9GLOM|nr:hypothetical protein RclHR1_07040006 [Rhizophagus clarus]GES79620.1 tropomyosin beta chain [Rhizophagus clarus]
MTETRLEFVTNKKHEVFNLLELPDPKSQLIRSECFNIKKDANFESLATNFGNLADLIRLAENGAYEHCEIQIQIRDIGRIITQFAGDTSLAIYAFERTSAEMAETWKTIYEYLLSSFEEEALIMISSIEELTKDMLDISVKLKQDAKIAGDKVKEISNTARKQKVEDLKKKKEINERKFKLLNEKKTWEKNEVDVEKSLDDLEIKMEMITKDVKEAEKSVYRWGIASIFVPFSKKIYQNAQNNAEIKRKENQRLIEEHRCKIAERREANKKIAAFCLSLMDCNKTQSILTEDVINSLDHAFSALNSIEGIIEAARVYWEKIYTHFKQLSTQKIDRIIKNGLKKDEEDKQKLYRSPPFKRQAIDVYVKCIAVKETCHEYKGLMEENHNNLVKYLKENPSREQSISIVNELSKKLLKNTETTNDNLNREEEELNRQEANLNDDFQANMELDLNLVRNHVTYK